jgi:hypothetical protein
VRGNPKFENDIMLEKQSNQFEYHARIEEQREILTEGFAKIANGEVFEPFEYEVMDDVWYRVTIKMVGRRGDTYIMMATFSDISEYKHRFRI